MPGTPTTPNFVAFNVRANNGAPTIREYPVDPTSAEIKPGDPVKEVAGGIIKKALVGDTALLGFAVEGNIPGNYVAREIPIAPTLTDASGRTLIRVAVADARNVFTGGCEVTPTQANVTKTFNLVADPANASGFVIGNNTSPTTNVVQVQRIIKDPGTAFRVEFQVAQGKSQYLGVSGA